ncbi:nucleotidyltransferase family protein [Rossellomorea sp. KS-H15a]|uniref:nucleotidyltransferase family protein n=1 Tax=Rossellomorea sp. KS-H15a TaxID=2963940 RepID=UPI0020C738F0|nr:nucleotidyltransferase family protein [Rossellomorea sp. KS-H15a]UTE75740.1 nucleotidyltransferase family protein [Rossellomorea sp. KS-H15a]
MIKSEHDILELVEQDSCMMEVLKTAHKLHLPDWWICAGFVRTKVWDTLHGYSNKTNLPDIDVVYFDASNTDEQFEKYVESRLKEEAPFEPWSVKNQARMHIKNGEAPYTSTIDAISRFPETATSIALKLNEKNELILAAPWGIEDLISLQIKPTPPFKEKEALSSIYEKRVLEKQWDTKWPKVKVHSI